jgi:DNA-binding transcriptional LysR family regulator
VGELGAEPRGRLRLHVSSVADRFLAEPLLAGFLVKCAHVQLEPFVGDARVEIVAAGYDAGVQIGEVIDLDMIAVPVTGDFRLVVVGAPSYFARRRPPTHPRELAEHECIN